MSHAIVTPCELFPAVWCTASVYTGRRPITGTRVTALDMIIAAVRPFERLRTIRRCAAKQSSLSLGVRILLVVGELFRRTLDRRTGF